MAKAELPPGSIPPGTANKFFDRTEQKIKAQKEKPMRRPKEFKKTIDFNGREPWSSGNGRRLMILRSWVRIPVPYTGWTFFRINLL